MRDKIRARLQYKAKRCYSRLKQADFFITDSYILEKMLTLSTYLNVNII